MHYQQRPRVEDLEKMENISSFSALFIAVRVEKTF